MYDEISQVIDEDKPHLIHEMVAAESFVKSFCYTNDANNTWLNIQSIYMSSIFNVIRYRKHGRRRG